MNIPNKDTSSEDRIVQGILSGLFYITPSSASPIEEARKEIEEIKRGLEIIPNQIKIRYVNSDDIERFKSEKFRYPQDIAPKKNDVLIEGESTGQFKFKNDFELITKTLFALRLLKPGLVYLRSIYCARANIYIEKEPTPYSVGTWDSPKA